MNLISDWRARLLALPIVHTRTNTIFKVMKIGIPHHDYSSNYVWNELCGSVKIFANLQIFSYSKRSTRGCVYEPKCNSQFVAMVTQMKYLFYFFHIIQNRFCTRHIHCIMHEPWQSLQLWMNSNYLGMVLILYYKCMDLIIHFNPGATWLVLCNFFLSLPFNILKELPVASSRIDIWQQHITSSIFRLQFHNPLSNAFCHLQITTDSASTKQNHPTSHLWFIGHCHDRVLCLL